MNKRTIHSGGFTQLLGTHEFGADPSHNNPFFQAPPGRGAVLQGNVLDEQGLGLNAALEEAAYTGQTATITVANNDFTTGRALLYLGDLVIISGLHFLQGAGVNNTATNLAAFINGIPGWTAPAPGAAVVTVTYGGPPTDDVRFEAEYHGTITNYTLAPTTRFLTNGTPALVAPVFT